ncbi:2-phosphosulfolactate phosphatase [Brevibacillus humidisoli]|uniref:2-phosphosulfolactate phosphatase n=1 Tax=Brevibacillus humidisoli TaxID=2895522 RepID=UPI001E40D401|nr:2-phosphosulfolactate phosphatase [Brevibacillus humidisoli]UFJ42927.1 2-phosphosulfolactate phosphatase [Brevibacillus humidisoli]
MRIEVVETVDEIRHDQIAKRTVVVIDVLRASSTIVTALAHDFSYIVPVDTVGQAFALRNSHSLLAGERHCKKISDFHYNNSPTDLMKAEADGRHLILTTTNGTRAIHKAERAEMLLVGCFLNATACMEQALAKRADITLYCAGSRQEFALEDGLAAGLMIHRAKQREPTLSVCDLGVALEASYQQFAEALTERVMLSATAKRLVQQQYTADIDHCCRVDLYQLVPVLREKRIYPHLVS